MAIRPVTPRSSRSWSGSCERGEHRPHLDRRRVAPGLLGAAPHLGHAAGQRLVGDEGVQDHPVEHAAGPAHRLEPEARRPSPGCRRRSSEPSVSSGYFPAGPSWPKIGLALPEPPVEADGVLHLGHRDLGDAHDVEQRADAPADAEGEAAPGEPVHRRAPTPAVTSGWRVGVLVTPVAMPTSSLTAAAAPHSVAASFTLNRSDRNTEPEPDALGVAHLVEQHPRVVDVPGQAVAAELHHALAGSPCPGSSSGRAAVRLPAVPGTRPRTADRRAARSGHLRRRPPRRARPAAGRGAAGLERHRGLLGRHPPRRRVRGVERPEPLLLGQGILVDEIGVTYDTRRR